MEIIKEKTVAFSGHRNFNQAFAPLIYDTVCSMCEKGFSIFLTGMAVGFDLAAAQAVIKARSKYPDIKLFAIVPYPAQDERFSPYDKIKYRRILSLSDEKIVVADSYQPDVFFKRNDFLICNSSQLICYYNGKRGGTMQTVNLAKNQRLSIINLHP